MDLTFTLHVWHVLALITGLVWTTFLCWPRPPVTGYASMANGLIDFINGVALLVASLIVWLIYFAVT